MVKLLRSISPTRAIMGRLFLWFWATFIVTSLLAIWGSRLFFEDLQVVQIKPREVEDLNQAIERIMHLAPKDMHDKLRFDLSMNIRAIVAQQLVPTIDGKGRVAAIEILLNSPLVTDLIQRNEIGSLKEAMKKGKEMGMQSFDMALYDHYKAGKISLDQALHHADSPNDLRLMIKLDTNEGSALGSLSNVSIDMD